MLTRIANSIGSRWNSSPWMNRAALSEAALDRAGGHPLDTPRAHAESAVDWITRAQDATPDDGVSRAYSVAWHPHFRRRGWQPSYPETTGYIIPTLFDVAGRWARPDLRERAVRMARWEIDVQMASGAVQGGVLGEGAEPTPAIFNTGQVILGWLCARRETGDEAFGDAARRAGDFLLDSQGPDGSFLKGESDFARSDATTYNTRVAWALCALGRDVDDARYVEAGEANLRMALARQHDNGWFPANCLSDPERPLLHTIAYAARGFLEAGLLLDQDDYLRAAERTARAVAAKQRPDGGLSGRFRSDWSDAADWSCVTGDAQTAIIWYKLASHLGDRELRNQANALCRFVMASQSRSAADPGLAGGIKGSFPFDGEYGRYELLNWAAKFTVDALVLCEEAAEGSRS